MDRNTYNNNNYRPNYNNDRFNRYPRPDQNRDGTYYRASPHRWNNPNQRGYYHNRYTHFTPRRDFRPNLHDHSDRFRHFRQSPFPPLDAANIDTTDDKRSHKDDRNKATPKQTSPDVFKPGNRSTQSPSTSSQPKTTLSTLPRNLTQRKLMNLLNSPSPKIAETMQKLIKDSRTRQSQVLRDMYPVKESDYDCIDVKAEVEVGTDALPNWFLNVVNETVGHDDDLNESTNHANVETTPILESKSVSENHELKEDGEITTDNSTESPVSEKFKLSPVSKPDRATFMSLRRNLGIFRATNYRSIRGLVVKTQTSPRGRKRHVDGEKSRKSMINYEKLRELESAIEDEKEADGKKKNKKTNVDLTNGEEKKIKAKNKPTKTIPENEPPLKIRRIFNEENLLKDIQESLNSTKMRVNVSEENLIVLRQRPVADDMNDSTNVVDMNVDELVVDKNKNTAVGFSYEMNVENAKRETETVEIETIIGQRGGETVGNDLRIDNEPIIDEKTLIVVENEPVTGGERSRVVENESIIDEKDLKSVQKDPVINEHDPKMVQNKPKIDEKSPNILENDAKVVEELIIDGKSLKIVENEPTFDGKSPKIVKKTLKVNENEPEIIEKHLTVVKNPPDVNEKDPTCEKTPKISDKNRKLVHELPTVDEKIVRNEPTTVENEPTIAEKHETFVKTPKIVETTPGMIEKELKIVEKHLKIVKKHANIVENDRKLAENQPKTIEKPKKIESESTIDENKQFSETNNNKNPSPINQNESHEPNDKPKTFTGLSFRRSIVPQSKPKPITYINGPSFLEKICDKLDLKDSGKTERPGKEARPCKEMWPSKEAWTDKETWPSSATEPSKEARLVRETEPRESHDDPTTRTNRAHHSTMTDNPTRLIKGSQTPSKKYLNKWSQCKVTVKHQAVMTCQTKRNASVQTVARDKSTDDNSRLKESLEKMPWSTELQDIVEFVKGKITSEDSDVTGDEKFDEFLKATIALIRQTDGGDVASTGWDKYLQITNAIDLIMRVLQLNKQYLFKKMKLGDFRFADVFIDGRGSDERRETSKNDGKVVQGETEVVKSPRKKRFRNLHTPDEEIGDDVKVDCGSGNVDFGLVNRFLPVMGVDLRRENVDLRLDRVDLRSGNIDLKVDSNEKVGSCSGKLVKKIESNTGKLKRKIESNPEKNDFQMEKTSQKTVNSGKLQKKIDSILEKIDFQPQKLKKPVNSRHEKLHFPQREKLDFQPQKSEPKLDEKIDEKIDCHAENQHLNVNTIPENLEPISDQLDIDDCALDGLPTVIENEEIIETSTETIDDASDIKIRLKKCGNTPRKLSKYKIIKPKLNHVINEKKRRVKPTKRFYYKNDTLKINTQLLRRRDAPRKRARSFYFQPVHCRRSNKIYLKTYVLKRRCKRVRIGDVTVFDMKTKIHEPSASERHVRGILKVKGNPVQLMETSNTPTKPLSFKRVKQIDTSTKSTTTINAPPCSKPKKPRNSKKRVTFTKEQIKTMTRFTSVRVLLEPLNDSRVHHKLIVPKSRELSVSELKVIMDNRSKESMMEAIDDSSSSSSQSSIRSDSPCDVGVVDEGVAGIFCSGFLGSIVCCKVIPDGLLACSSDSNIYKFDATGQLLCMFEEHNAAVTSLHTSHSIAYSVGMDSYLWCFNVNTMNALFNAHFDAAIQCMAVSEDVAFLGTVKGTLHRYDLTRQVTLTCEKIARKTIVAICMASSRRLVVVAARSEPVSIFDADTLQKLRVLTQDKMTVYSLFVREDVVYCGTSHNRVFAYDLETGIQKRIFKSGKGVVCTVVKDDILYAGCYDGYVYAFNVLTSELIAQIKGPNVQVMAVQVTDSKIFIACKDSPIRIVDVSVTMKM